MWLLMWLSFYTWSLVDCFYKEKGHSQIHTGKTNSPLQKIFGNMINMPSELWNKQCTFRKYGIICIAIYRMIPDEESGIRNGNVRVSIKSGHSCQIKPGPYFQNYLPLTDSECSGSLFPPRWFSLLLTLAQSCSIMTMSLGWSRLS